MSNPFRVLPQRKPGDTREISEKALKKAHLEGHFDSYSQIYELDGGRWKIQGQVARSTGETVYTLVSVDD